MPAIRTSKAETPGPSRVSRQRKVKEDSEDAAPAAEMALTTQKLNGDVPPLIPCNADIDQEKGIVFFNSYNNHTKYGSELYSLDLATRTWKNLSKKITFLPPPIGTPKRARQLPPRVGGAMAFFKYRSSGQRVILIFGGQVNGMDQNDLGEVSGEMIAIDVDRCKWWVMDIAGGPVTPRVDADLIVVGDQLFILGGREYVDGEFRWVKSYSVATLKNNHWAWTTRDAAFPADVQALGVCDAGVAIEDGNSPKILLMFNQRADIDVDSWTFDVQPGSFVVFDIRSLTFMPQGGEGTFPGKSQGSYGWYHPFQLPQNLNARPSPSVILCIFAHKANDQDRNSVELYTYSLPPPGGDATCKSLTLTNRIAATKKEISFGQFLMVGNKSYLLGVTNDKWNVMAEIPQGWIEAEA
ncbi:hypothetical protein B0H13DRAFT_2672830 [Mycena leptocephala]|nr:hypothetical protein B0H13DRAFT_2672830 [Mycena leptocephala]